MNKLVDKCGSRLGESAGNDEYIQRVKKHFEARKVFGGAQNVFETAPSLVKSHTLSKCILRCIRAIEIDIIRTYYLLELYLPIILLTSWS